MHKIGMADTPVYLFNGLLMIFVFFCCRNIWGTYMSYQFFVDTRQELLQPTPNGFPSTAIWIYRIANVALNLLNFYWFHKMASKALAIFTKGKKPSEVSKGT